MKLLKLAFVGSLSVLTFFSYKLYEQAFAIYRGYKATYRLIGECCEKCPSSLQVNLQSIENKVTHHYIMSEKLLNQLVYFTVGLVLFFFVVEIATMYKKKILKRRD